MEDGYETVKLI